MVLSVLLGFNNITYALSDGIRFYPSSVVNSVADLSGSGCESYPSTSDLRWLLSSTLNNDTGIINTGAAFGTNKTCLDISPFDLIGNGTSAVAGTTYYLSLYTSFANYLSNDSFGYFQFYFDGVKWTETPTSTAYFTSFTYSTSTDIVNITGYWEATTTPHINQRLTFWQYTALLGKTNYQEVVATTTGNFDLSFSFTEPTTGATTSTTTSNIISSYVLNATLDLFDNTFAASLGYPDDSLDYIGYKTPLDATSTIISVISLDYTATLQNLLNYPEYECGITSITGCIKNAAIWLFFPTIDTIQNYNKLIDVIQSKPPVGYFTMVKSNISGLSATSTKAFNLIIPASIKNNIFNPFDIGVAGILWLFFIFNFYKRLKHITI